MTSLKLLLRNKIPTKFFPSVLVAISTKNCIAYSTQQIHQRRRLLNLTRAEWSP